MNNIAFKLLHCLLISYHLIHSLQRKKITVTVENNNIIMISNLFRKISSNKLGISEPNPSWFGNKPNEVNNPYWTNSNWLKSRFHFSFAEYSNPKNNNFGVLRVLNDDLVQPNRGFGAHPHRDAEICTYIVHGKLSHKDSMGTEETIGRGAIQFMTAGSGVTHSEHNLDLQNPLRFIQIWITTRKHGLKPNYGSLIDNPDVEAARSNQWSHLVSDVDSSTPTSIKINQDVNIFVTEITPGNNVTVFNLQQGRQAYLICMEGSAEITGLHGTEILHSYDAAELFGPNELSFQLSNYISNSNSNSSNSNNNEQLSSHTIPNTHLLLIEMKYTGIGRSDL